MRDTSGAVIDANRLNNNGSDDVAVPAPETIQEFKIQTSLYDATFGRGGGGNVQAVTRSGGNEFHGAAMNTSATTRSMATIHS